MSRKMIPTTTPTKAMTPLICWPRWKSSSIGSFDPVSVEFTFCDMLASVSESGVVETTTPLEYRFRAKKSQNV